jgi:ArsR family transcriptional regulator
LKGDVPLNNKKETYDCQTIQSDVLKKVSEEMPKDTKLKQLADIYKVFSDPTRIQILWVLGNKALYVGDLAALLNMSSSAVSHQLKILRLVKLVTSRRNGKNISYSLCDDRVKDILLQGFGYVNE